MSERPRLSVAEAAAAYDVTRRTLQRRLAAGDLAGATKDDAGYWSIPIEALHAAGLVARQGTTNDATPAPNGATHDAPNDALTATNRTKSTKKSATHGAPNGATELATLRATLRDTQQQLDAEKRLREAAERNADDLRSAMRMIEAGTAQPPSAAGENPTPRRRWWHRRRTSSAE